VAASLLALAGCVPVYVMTPPPGGYPAVEPLDLAVGLVISGELRDVHLMTPQLPDGGPQFHVGKAMADTAEEVCRKVFAQVEVDTTPPKGVDLFVFPRLVSMRTTRPMTIFDDVPLTVVLEWKVVTPRERLIWLETVRSTAWEPPGFLLPAVSAHYAIKRMDAVFQNLFLRSHAALAGSPEIRAYAAQVSLPEGTD
jgi:hypothetical protein